jgi:hypothetical protein
MRQLAAYLANRPTGAPAVYLVLAVAMMAVALTWAGWTRDLYRALMAAGLGFLALALLTH